MAALACPSIRCTTLGCAPAWIARDAAVWRKSWAVIRAGTALLADFRELCLFMRDTIRIDIATQGNPTGAEYDLFESNAFVVRTEVPVGVGVLRPQAFAVIALPGGS
jgi:hypothetical protein